MWICFFFFLFIFVNYLFILVGGSEGGGVGLVDNKLNYKTNWYDINIGFIYLFIYFTKIWNTLILVTIERVEKISKHTKKKFPSHELLFKLPSIYSQSIKILKEKHPWTLWKYRAHKQNTASKWPKKKKST